MNAEEYPPLNSLVDFEALAPVIHPPSSTLPGYHVHCMILDMISYAEHYHGKVPNQICLPKPLQEVLEQYLNHGFSQKIVKLDVGATYLHMKVVEGSAFKLSRKVEHPGKGDWGW